MTKLGLKAQEAKQLSYVKRHPLLRRLEGWYLVDRRKIKFSCRYNDIRRCSAFPRGKPIHFYSCYNPLDGVFSKRPIRLCQQNNWAIIYMPDKHGNFLGRCFVEFGWTKFCIPTLIFHRYYGNVFPNWDSIRNELVVQHPWLRFIRVRYSPHDVHFGLV